jgi:type II secretory pathway pseudopilin PulG
MPASAQKSDSPSKGFTIIEMVIVVFVLLVIVLTIIYSVDRSLRTSNEIYRMTTSTFLAQRKIEEVMARASCYTTGGECQLNGVKPGFFFYHDFKQNFCAHPAGYCAATHGVMANCNADCGCLWAGACTDFDTPCEFPAPFQQFKCRVYYLDASNDPAEGGGLVIPPDYLKEIQVRVWFDENYNNIKDMNEADVLYQTAITYRSPTWNFGQVQP